MNRRRDSHTDQYDAEDATLSGDEAKSVTPKKSKRGVKKRVVSIPIGDVERSKSKGEAYPPSDSWAWRKYGQKPIKGSPYPRGYYRCSSLKGCPARKQVERSRVDPSTVLITYAGDHNHAVPATKHHHHNQSTAASPATPSSPSARFGPEDIDIGGFSGFGHEFGWLADVTSASTLLHSPILCGNDDQEDASTTVVVEEEEESFFADLGELPECSMVFRRSLHPHAPRLSAITCLGGSG